MLQSSQAVALPAATQSGNVALQGPSEGVEVETVGSGTSINSLHKPGMIGIGVVESLTRAEHLVEDVPAHGGVWNKMAFKVSSHTNHSVISGKQNPLEHPSTNSVHPLRNGLYPPGRAFPMGLDPEEREKGFQHPGASPREVGEMTASLSRVRAGLCWALTFHGSLAAGSLGSLSSRSPAAGSRAEPCCRAATCMGTGTQHWGLQELSQPCCRQGCPSSLPESCLCLGGPEGAGEEQL